MKTKIIYISGDSAFEINEIRAAFDEVRTTLGLGNDTVLFGVPMDDESVADNVKVPSVRKIRAKRPDLENQTEIKPIPESVPTPDEKVIPILSILSSQESDDIAPTNKDADEPIQSVTTQRVTVAHDVITDDLPDDDTESSLEDLFEKITPLGEDIIAETIAVSDEINSVVTTDTTDVIYDKDSDADVTMVDATLEQLASEFVSAQEQIISEPTPESSGKIGKLKNILPFKKAKREEPSLIGDLFGWAGIAANEDEFTMPGFFAKAQ